MSSGSENSGENGNAPALPLRLPGLDIGDGVQRIGGDSDFFVEMVKDYCEVFLDFDARFRNLISRKDYLTARREAHSLKGAAGNISAKDLFTTAKALEHACNGKDDTQILKLLLLVEEDLAIVKTSAARLSALVGAKGSGPARVKGPGKALDPEKLLALFQGLSESLVAFDPVQSRQYLDKISEVDLPDIPKEDLKSLEREIDQYEFDGAGKTLERVIQTLTNVK